MFCLQQVYKCGVESVRVRRDGVQVYKCNLLIVGVWGDGGGIGRLGGEEHTVPVPWITPELVSPHLHAGCQQHPEDEKAGEQLEAALGEDSPVG